MMKGRRLESYISLTMKINSDFVNLILFSHSYKSFSMKKVGTFISHIYLKKKKKGDSERA